MTGIRRYEPLRSRHGFRHRAAQVRVADVRIVASTSTPLAASISASHPGGASVSCHRRPCGDAGEIRRRLGSARPPVRKTDEAGRFVPAGARFVTLSGFSLGDEHEMRTLRTVAMERCRGKAIRLSERRYS